MADRPEFSVVVPVHNESGNVETLIDEIARALDPSAPELARARASLARLLDATPACEATLPSADPALLIEQARDSYTTLGEGFTDERDELTRWLEGRSRS